MRGKPKFNQGARNGGDALRSPSSIPRRRKLPAWLVDDVFDQEVVDWDAADEPPIKRYPGWIRVLLIVGISAGLWWLIITAVSFLIGGFK